MVAATVVDFVENFILCQKKGLQREEDRKKTFVFAAGFGWSEVSEFRKTRQKRFLQVVTVLRGENFGCETIRKKGG